MRYPYGMDEIIPHLWVGDLTSSLDPEYLSHADIRRVVSCVRAQPKLPENIPTEESYRHIPKEDVLFLPLEDLEESPIYLYFGLCNRFIAAGLDETWVSASSNAVTDTENAVDNNNDVGADEPHMSTDAHVEASSKEDPCPSTYGPIEGLTLRHGEQGVWVPRAPGSVLVHCEMGCSRSVTVRWLLFATDTAGRRLLDVESSIDGAAGTESTSAPAPDF